MATLAQLTPEMEKLANPLASELAASMLFALGTRGVNT